jgi:hypothetical protein
MLCKLYGLYMTEECLMWYVEPLSFVKMDSTLTVWIQISEQIVTIIECYNVWSDVKCSCHWVRSCEVPTSSCHTYKGTANITRVRQTSQLPDERNVSQV